jgi:hypothetical protein
VAAQNKTSQVVRGAVGVAALGFFAAQTIKERRRPKAFGMKLPRELTKLEPGNLDVQKLAKQVAKAADRLERTSEDVRMISAQTKRLSKKLA